MVSIGVAIAVSASSFARAATLSDQSEFPNLNTDLQRFLSAQQGLSNAIDMILARENISQIPSDVGSLPSRPLIFGTPVPLSQGSMYAVKQAFAPQCDGHSGAPLAL
jgi:hypothetical protein